MSSGVCPPPPNDYSLPTSFPDLRQSKIISIDLETVDPGLREKGIGVRRGDGYVVGVTVCSDDWAGEYYPIAHRNGPNLQEDKVYAWLRANLNEFRGTITGANVSLYDGDWLQYKGVIPQYAKWWDVQWAEALLDETALNYKLNTLAKKYLGQTKVTEELRALYGPDYIYRFNEVHPGHARAYGLGDVHLPMAIKELQKVELERTGMSELMDLESRLTPFLLYLRRQGVRVDLDRIQGFKPLLTAKRSEALRQASEACGVQLNVDNFGKNAVLAHIFNKLKIDFPVTPKGQPSIQNKWLEKLEHPVGKALAAANKYDKALETFVYGYIDDFQINGRVHGEFHPLRQSDDEGDDAGAETGRFSSNHPNLQNIPTRDEELGPLLRGMFVPEPGAEWWSLDYSQIEYRCLVHFAVINKCKGAKDAQQMYINDPNTDFHVAVSKLTGLKRKDAKNLNFGLVYGMGPQKLAESLGLLDKKLVDGIWKMVPSKAALDIMETYHAKAPFIKALYRLCADRADDTGETRTILNRRRQFELYEPRKWEKGKARSAAKPYDQAIELYGFDIKRSMTHKACNSTLQGSAADVMKKAMVLSWEAGVFSSTKDFTCSLTVHDELDGSIAPTPRGLECFEELKRIMQTAVPMEVPVLVGEGRGADWSEAK